MKKHLKLTNKLFRKHEILFVTFTILLTIVLTRFLAFIHNANPTIYNFELHHFDYGLILLIIVHLIVIFGKIPRLLYLSLSGIALGLIIDDYWFIRGNILDPSTNEMAIYHATFPSIWIPLLIVVVVSLIFWRNKVDKINKKSAQKIRKTKPFNEKVSIFSARIFKYFNRAFVAVLADYSILIALLRFTETHYITALMVAFSIGHTLNFFTTKTGVFHGTKIKKREIRVNFILLGIFSLIIMTAATWTMTEFFGIFYLTSKTISTLFVGALNFGASYTITYDLERELE